MRYLKTLSSVTQNDAAAGRRALDLALLQSQRFRTPQAAVVMSTAFDALVAENNLKYKIDYIISHVQQDVPQSLNNAYTGIRKAIMEAKLPDGLEPELKELFESITSGINLSARPEKRLPVRIILSLNRDDDPESNDTIIQNVREEELLTGVREAWALAYHPRQLEARMRERFPESKLKVAMVIQTMDRPTTTVHAHSSLPHDHAKVFLQTYYGYPDLRERVNKDYYALRKDDLSVVGREIREQPTMLDIDRNGELTAVTLPGKSAHDRLIDREVQEAARLAKKAERVLGTPVKAFLTIKDDIYDLLWVNRLGFDVLLGKEEPTATPAIDAQESPAQESATPEEVREIAQALVEESSPEPPQETIRSTELMLLEASLNLARQTLRTRFPALPDHDLSELLSTLAQEGTLQADASVIRAAETALRDCRIEEQQYAKAMAELAALLQAL